MILFLQFFELDVQLLLVGLKCDLESERKISYDVGKQVSLKITLPFQVHN